MARQLTDQQHEELADRLQRECGAEMARRELHVEQVDAGLIPADSPPGFIRPEGDDALVDGLPWFYGPGFDRAEALEALQAADEGPGA